VVPQSAAIRHRHRRFAVSDDCNASALPQGLRRVRKGVTDRCRCDHMQAISTGYGIHMLLQRWDHHSQIMPATTLTPHEVRRVAVEAVADDRTVRRYLRNPHSVRSTSAVRIAEALARLGLHGPQEPRQGPARVE